MSHFQQLISCIDLHAILDSPDLVVLDASIPPVGNMAPATYSWPKHRIAKARRFDLNQHFSDLSNNYPHTMPTAAQFEHAAQALGINQRSQIVVYDDLGLFSAARAWYMFKAMGHKNIAVLDGGLPYWIKLKKPLAVETEPKIVTGDFEAHPQADYFCHWQEVQAQTLSQQELILDARGQARFSGKEAEPRAGVRSGHMPNAKNLPYTELFRQGLLKPRAELAQIFTALNRKNKPMIMSCGSGVTACILALAAELSGHNAVRVYDGSWSEWGALAETDVVTD
ncbi:thiosulfate/3-mercaptopyruvate sulfurtransferase [Colwellia chukchiensis]|uniref:Sulfurtransferase n=1 Tax=Colwellia chukchiensis TaxID=641665 RepID=A0A1H7RC82_9GAMM|nr:sulfurtransferase [Colwellia chukchiensis]SEL57831.1 thiosulfate/3-mercaptopyruvate sulfurtransferase [Colwellia chukchiensis]